MSRYFNPRSPCGERPQPPDWVTCCMGFQSTLPVWGATVTGDPDTPAKVEFQSTLPVWGATTAPTTIKPIPRDFNPRSPCGERQALAVYGRAAARISIHAPRVGSDARQVSWASDIRISIHAPRVGSDINVRPTEEYCSSFQSTLPVWGATKASSGLAGYSWRFQSTLPVWGATGHQQRVRRPPRISIHAPRVGSDPAGQLPGEGGKEISIHAPRVGSDVGQDDEVGSQADFNPRSPCGERRNIAQE